VLVVAVCFALQSSTAVPRDISSPEQRLFDLVNQERAKAGLLKLEWNDHLADAARAPSCTAAVTTFWACAHQATVTAMPIRTVTNTNVSAASTTPCPRWH